MKVLSAPVEAHVTFETVDKKLTPKDLSPDQRRVFDAIRDWVGSASIGRSILTMGGYAGAGKSTVLGVLARSLQDGGIGPVAYVCFTGRASSVLARKLRATGVQTTSKTLRSGGALRSRFASLFYSASSPEAGLPYCGTIHRLLYRPVIDEKTEELKGWVKRDGLDRQYRLLIVDEASMVSDELLQDLQAHGAPLLAVGDHGQLPPVMATGNLMRRPDLRLEKIHRQAEGSAIIRIAHHVREGGSLAGFDGWDNAVELLPKAAIGDVFKRSFRPDAPLDTVAVCWTNRVRCRLNEEIRTILGYASDDTILSKGEVAICLRNKPPVYNGMRGIATSNADPDSEEPWRAHVSLEFPEEGLSASHFEICIPQLGREKTYLSVDELKQDEMPCESMKDAGSFFDYGYACTVHKMQGSGIPHVIFYVDRPEDGQDETRRFFYTAITRASERLTILAGRR